MGRQGLLELGEDVGFAAGRVEGGEAWGGADCARQLGSLQVSGGGGRVRGGRGFVGDWGLGVPSSALSS